MKKNVFVLSLAVLTAGLFGVVRGAAAEDLSSFAPVGYTNIPNNAQTTGANLVTLVIVTGAILTLAYMLWGAINIIMAGGDSGKVEEARDQIMYAVIGLIVLASVWAIFQLVMKVSLGTSDVPLPTLTGS